MDAVALEVARNRLAAIADEMGVVLRRTAYSPNIKERADCSAAVFVPGGEMLAQAEHIPVHLGSMPASVAAVLEFCGQDLQPGTDYAVNDPYAGGTHLNDITLVRPVVDGGDVIGFVANRAHHADVGGEAPGSMPAHATRIDQEGCIISPMKAANDGEWLPEFVEPLLEATRTPAERLGDLSAQLGANATGARRYLAFAGNGRHAALADTILDYGERRMRAALKAIPDGEYLFTDHLEWGDDDVAVAVRLVVAGDQVHADLTGSDPQVEGNINAVEAVTRSCLYYAIRVATDPSIPTNGGCYRPLSLATRPGTVVAASPPVAVAAGNVEASQRIADAILGALAKAVPYRIPAAGQGTMNNILIGAADFAYYETVAGGQGGRPGGPGQSGIHTGMTNTRNTPVEALEAHYPFRVLRYGLRRGSGGSGHHPGGDGIVREVEFLVPATVSLMGERRRLAPWGLWGGAPGAVGEDWLIRKGRRERLPGKVTFDVEPGDHLLTLTPGGGGWNPPGTG